MIKKGQVYQCKRQNDLLVKVLETAKHINNDNLNVVVYKQVMLDIGFKSDGTFDLDFEYNSKAFYMDLPMFSDYYEEFELDRETIMRIREGVYNG